ncbi:MAG TPA: Gfo/Idh/MocA family oxidoreductase [Micromonosporaceae bacterium]
MGLRFGLLGTGHWAVATQGAALAAHQDAEFVGVWGRDPAKAHAVATRYGVRAYPEVDALLRDVDAVAVALPPDVQAELAVRAAEAGRHLLLDKPLALSWARAHAVVDAVRRRDLASLVFFTARFQPNVAAFLADAVRAGDWHGARVTHFGSIFESGGPYAGSTWRREWGGLWDVGPHALALLLPVLGPVVEVRAVDGPRSTTHLLLCHDGGAVSTASLTVDAPAASTANEVVFHGPAGFVTVPPGEGRPVEAFGTAISDLIAAVADGRVEDPRDVHFGRAVVGVLEAAEQARRTGRAVAVPPERR